MNEQEKSLELAKLMGWELEEFSEYGETFDTIIEDSSDYNFVCRESLCYLPTLEPYIHSEEGLAQFADILLKFPEVIPRMCAFDDIDCGVKLKRNWNGVMPTQENILDEILKTNEVAG